MIYATQANSLADEYKDTALAAMVVKVLNLISTDVTEKANKGKYTTTVNCGSATETAIEEVVSQLENTYGYEVSWESGSKDIILSWK